MLLLNKDFALCVMKFISALFLCGMLFKGISIVASDDDIEEFESGEDCSKYVIFHICAFTLGAFWNVKRLLKIGIV
jgi:hypothetical protein